MSLVKNPEGFIHGVTITNINQILFPRVWKLFERKFYFQMFERNLTEVWFPKVWKLFDRAAMVAKRELQYTGTFGLGIKLCGTVFVDRASSEAGRAAVNAAGKKARESATR